MAAAQYVAEIETFLLDKIAIEIDFVVETSLYVPSLAVDSTEIDVEQLGCTIDIECTCWYAIFGIVDISEGVISSCP